jgi:hypothetical protein
MSATTDFGTLDNLVRRAVAGDEKAQDKLTPAMIDEHRAEAARREAAAAEAEARSWEGLSGFSRLARICRDQRRSGAD